MAMCVYVCMHVDVPVCLTPTCVFILREEEGSREKGQSCHGDSNVDRGSALTHVGLA